MTVGSILIDEVSIKEKEPIDVTIQQDENRRMHVEYKAKGDDILESSINILELVKKTAPAFQVINGEIVFRGPNAFYNHEIKGALIVIDEIHKFSKINSVEDLINIDDIYEIRITQGPAAALKYSGQHLGGLIEITTKGNEKYFDSLKVAERPKPNLDMVSGYMIKRQFYSPEYDLMSPDSVPKTDLRSTLYWNPEVITDEAGQATVTFYNSDIKGPVSVVIEGICKEGLLGSGSYQYQVGVDSIPVMLK